MTNDDVSEDFEPDSNNKHESKLGDEINRLLHSLGSPNIDTVSGVFGLWGDLVGDQVASHVTPIKLVVHLVFASDSGDEIIAPAFINTRLVMCASTGNSEAVVIKT